jgi:hypothetical protein
MKLVKINNMYTVQCSKGEKERGHCSKVPYEIGAVEKQCHLSSIPLKIIELLK